MNTNNKVLTNFRDHPALRFDDQQSVFKIEDKVYLISGGFVRQIKPKSIEQTNIGEPYRKLIRLNYILVDNRRIFEYGAEEFCISFASEDEEALRQLLN